MAPSFFSRLARHRPGLFLDQRENQLTEITAALLEQSNGFLQRFIEYLLEDGADSEAFRPPLAEAMLEELRAAHSQSALLPTTVGTQIPTPGGRFVDLGIELGEPGTGKAGMVVWVEIKDGSDIHGDQLHAYAQEIVGRAAGRSSCLILLVPRGWETRNASGIPSTVLVADWEGVAAIAEEEARVADGHLAWLLDEYANYLKEEGLSKPDIRPLDAFSARALQEADSIEDTELALCEETVSILRRSWGPVRIDLDSSEEIRSPEGKDFWVQFYPNPGRDAAASSWRQAWFELTFVSSTEMDRPELTRAESVFVAGATFFTKEEIVEAASDEDWMARRADEGFNFFRLNGYHRVARLCYPDELISEATLRGQAKKLSDWTTAAFRALAENARVAIESSPGRRT
jgi:hypothetical protein